MPGLGFVWNREDSATQRVTEIERNTKPIWQLNKTSEWLRASNELSRKKGWPTAALFDR